MTLSPQVGITGKKLTRILVANRGEIALRVIRSAIECGLETVAIYADQDLESAAVRLADQAYSLDGTTINDTYLNADKILEIARRSGADAVHPGYGFLSEDPEFARRVEAAGMLWIGPAATSLEKLGNKILARRVAQSVAVSPVPGLSDPVADIAQVRKFADTHGFPLALKRADGGGGRGIHMLHNEVDLDNFAAQFGADAAALEAFFVERLVIGARHVETQCGRDSYGNFQVYSTRDCSVQRRNQKLAEEAPAPYLSEAANTQLQEWSGKLFEAVDYVGLGTCEFLLEPTGEIWFLEVNPRLQVEHTVSEEVCGVDLVREQFEIAKGATITRVAEITGHSIQLRITSENPAENLMPGAGSVSKLQWPTGLGIRIEPGIETGGEVAPDFDSMLAKIIVTAPDRATAIARARRALEETVIHGVPTPMSLYREILAHPDFIGAQYTGGEGEYPVYTKWLENVVLPDVTLMERVKASTERELAAGTPTAYSQDKRRSKHIIEIDGRRHELSIPGSLLGDLTTSHGRRAYPYQPVRSARTDRRAGAVSSAKSGETPSGELTADGTMVSPIQAIIIRYTVAPGDRVASGQLLVVLESMKMESYIYAPCAGTVTEILSTAGASVNAGTDLLKLTEEEK